MIVGLPYDDGDGCDLTRQQQVLIDSTRVS
jgi:hypothetical protein